MSAVADVKPFHSLDDFLKWENCQEARYELLDGVMHMMAGGTEGHDAIAMNIIRALGNALLDSPCRVHGSNLKVLSRERKASMYPDVFVRCGPRGDRRTSIEDAVVVFEVLSDSTARNDAIRKRRAYTAMPSVQRIVYVQPDEPVVNSVVRRADGRFEDEEIEGLDQVLELPEIGAVLPLAEIYRDTDVADARAE